MRDYLQQLQKHKEYDIQIGFVPLHKLSIPSCLEQNASLQNRFIDKHGWETFKESLLKGVLWVFYIGKYEYSICNNTVKNIDNYTVIEGFHRFKALLELVNEGRLRPDHQILCAVVEYEKYYEHVFFKELQRIVSRYKDITPDDIIPLQEVNEVGYYWNTLQTIS